MDQAAKVRSGAPTRAKRLLPNEAGPMGLAEQDWPPRPVDTGDAAVDAHAEQGNMSF